MTDQPKNSDVRPGEIALPFDPAADGGDASVVFVGRARTPRRYVSQDQF